jgi:hypothetical protein
MPYKSITESSTATLKPEPCMLKTIVTETPKPKEDPSLGGLPKTNSLTVELGDALLDVFKTFTDRH